MRPATAAPTAQRPEQRPGLARRRFKDRGSAWLFLVLTALPLTITAAMLLALTARARPILVGHTLGELLAGQTWQPMQGQFGFYPFIVGTLWVTALAMFIAVPPSLFTAVYLAEYAQPTTRTLSKPMLDLLAAIPSVVYGIWGVVAIVPWVGGTLAPALNRWFGFIPFFAGTNPTGFSVLSGSLVLAVMVTPVIIAISYEVLRAVPDGLREAAMAMGTTRWQAIVHAVLPKALPGVAAAVVLGFSRAFGETMAVLMVVGNVAKTPSSIFDPAYPLTALIANNYGEMMSIPLYDAALMGAALTLLLVVLAFNVVSMLVLRGAVRRAAA
jgi:phosphate transport system permease protein